MGFEPMNTGFADQRVSHFATGAHPARLRSAHRKTLIAGKIEPNRKPTSLVSRVGHLSLDPNRSNLPNPKLRAHPHAAPATAATASE